MRGKEGVSLGTCSVHTLGELYASYLCLIAIYNLLRFYLTMPPPFITKPYRKCHGRLVIRLGCIGKQEVNNIINR